MKEVTFKKGKADTNPSAAPRRGPCVCVQPVWAALPPAVPAGSTLAATLAPAPAQEGQSHFSLTKENKPQPSPPEPGGQRLLHLLRWHISEPGITS